MRPGSPNSVNHSAPVRARHDLLGVRQSAERPAVNSVTAPAGVMRAIAPGGLYSVNHRFPSGPTAIEVGPLFAVKPGTAPAADSVTTAFVVTRATRPGLLYSVIQRLPSGPATIPNGVPPAEKPGVTPPVSRSRLPRQDLRDPPRTRALGEPQPAVGAGDDLDRP